MYICPTRSLMPSSQITKNTFFAYPIAHETNRVETGPIWSDRIVALQKLTLHVSKQFFVIRMGTLINPRYRKCTKKSQKKNERITFERIALCNHFFFYSCVVLKDASMHVYMSHGSTNAPCAIHEKQVCIPYFVLQRSIRVLTRQF